MKDGNPINREIDVDLAHDKEFMAIHKQIAPYTMTSIERQYALFKATQYIDRRNISGAIVECGVWKGGSSMLVAQTLKNLGNLDRRLFLYDTFSGMSEPTDKDVRYNKIDTFARWRELQNGDVNQWCFAPLDEVKHNMNMIEYPEQQLSFVVGKVEETIPETLPEQIALLRLDTDWYESTRHELIHLFPLLSSGGVLIVDDYGCWEGARLAIDEYFEQNKIQILLNRIDYTGRIGIK